MNLNKDNSEEVPYHQKIEAHKHAKDTTAVRHQRAQRVGWLLLLSQQVGAGKHDDQLRDVRLQVHMHWSAGKLEKG